MAAAAARAPSSPGSGSSWGSRRRGSARSGSAARTTARAGPSVARPRRCSRWSRCSAPPFARRGRGRPRRSRRSLEAVVPHLAREARVVLLLEHGGPEALAAAVLGGVGAGYRLVEARLADPDDEVGGVVELIPPRGVLPPGPRTRSNVRLDAGPGGRGDPEMVPGPGLFAPPERIEARPFSAKEAAATVLETAIEVLQARGEPARYERLLGEILVGLDRSGQLRRLVMAEAPRAADRRSRPRRTTAPATRAGRPTPFPGTRDAASDAAARAAAAGGTGPARDADPHVRPAPEPRDPVERVLALVGDELGRADPASRRRDRARPLVARRAARPRRCRDPARRPRRVGRLQPAVDRRPHRRGRVLRARSPPSSRATTCRTRRSSGPALPATAAPPRPRPPRDQRGPPPPHRRAHRAARAPRERRPSAGDARLDRAARPGAPDRRPDARRLPRPPRARAVVPDELARARRRTARRSTASGTSAAARRSCSRSSGRRCSATSSCGATRGSRRTSGWSASSSSRPERRELARHKLESSPRAPRRDGGGELAPGAVAAPPGLAGPRARSTSRTSSRTSASTRPSSVAPSSSACSKAAERATLTARALSSEAGPAPLDSTHLEA